MKSRFPARGEVWLAQLDPARGHEQGGRRPCLVVSNNDFNEGPSGLVVVLPITSRDKRIRFHIRLDPPEGGVKSPSFIKPEDVRSVSKERLVKRMGKVGSTSMKAAAGRLRTLLDLYDFDE